MKKLVLMSGIVVIAILLFSNVSNVKAQQVQPDNKKVQNMGSPGRLKALNLTEDQKTKIEKLTISHLKEMKDIKNQLNEKRARLVTLKESDNPDMNALNKTVDEITALSGTMMKKGLAHQQEVRKLLTDEQKLKYDAMQKNKIGKGKMKNQKQGRMKGNMRGNGMGQKPRFQGGENK